MSKGNLRVGQIVAFALTALMLSLMILSNLGWLGSWISGIDLLPRDATYNYNDFAAESTAMKLADKSQLYDVDAQLALQQQLWGDRLPEILKQPFVRVPWSVFLLWPLAQLPHAVGFLTITTLSIIAAIVALLLWARWAGLPPMVRLAFIFGGLGSLPLLRTLVLGQHSAFLLLALTGAILWSMKGCYAWAGAALVATTLKPHLIMLVPLAWLLQRRWAALAAGAAGLVILSLLSWLALGTTNILGFFSIQSDFDRLFPGAEAIDQMQNWRGLLYSTLGLSGSAIDMLNLALMGAMALVAAWAWWPSAKMEKGSDDLRWALTVLTSLLFSYHLHLNDLLVWVIPAAIGLRRVYAAPAGFALGEREKQVTLALVWAAWTVPWITFFAPGARPALWLALLATAVIAVRINREKGATVEQARENTQTHAVAAARN